MIEAILKHLGLDGDPPNRSPLAHLTAQQPPLF